MYAAGESQPAAIAYIRQRIATLINAMRGEFFSVFNIERTKKILDALPDRGMADEITAIFERRTA
jgi:hypothetical protein